MLVLLPSYWQMRDAFARAKPSSSQVSQCRPRRFTRLSEFIARTARTRPGASKLRGLECFENPGSGPSARQLRRGSFMGFRVQGGLHCVNDRQSDSGVGSRTSQLVRRNEALTGRGPVQRSRQAIRGRFSESIEGDQNQRPIRGVSLSVSRSGAGEWRISHDTKFERAIRLPARRRQDDNAARARLPSATIDCRTSSGVATATSNARRPARGPFGVTAAISNP